MKRTVRHLSALGLLAALYANPSLAVFQLYDVPYPAQEVDYRIGKSAPLAMQADKVAGLKAKANWNRFGTVHTLIRHGGFLGSGLSGTPVQAAREWVRQNRELFKLSEAGVADLEVVNDGVTPYNEARAILFRQRLGGLKPAGGEGLITVGIVNGKVYYVSSTSVGEQPMPGPAVLSPLAAWLKAAADVQMRVLEADVLKQQDKSADLGWHLFKVANFAFPQRARLVAMALPEGGLRQVYETIVLDVRGGDSLAYVHYVDAETGAILRRENRVYNAAEAVVPTFISGNTGDDLSCAARHDYAVAGGAADASLVATAAMVSPGNALNLKLYRLDDAGNASLVAQSPATTGPAEVLAYAPSGGVPAGNYQLEVCAQESFLGDLLPYNYMGVIATLPVDTSLASVLLGADSNAPQWKFFPSNPSQDYLGEDVRKMGCFAPLPTGGLGGCDIDLGTTASRAPWDTLLGLIPTFTTIGNNAITAGGSISPLTPSIPNLPLSPTRKYEFPFNNAWYESGCSPNGIVVSQVPNSNGNDLSAVTVNLFVNHNRIHDFSYHLGFTEKNYNLQISNFGLTPITQQNDPEIGTAQAGAIGGHPALPTFGTAPGRNNANQISLMDGVPGITNQYLFQPVGGLIYPPCADGSLDAGIVGHEYTHAISNRMVGGPDGNLLGAQAGAMGESWGDLNATEYQLANDFQQPGGFSPTALAGYTTGNPESGIRNFALDNNPLNYGNMGYDTPGPQVHADGEIWNGTQWAIRQALIEDYDAQFPSTDKELQRKCAAGLEGPNGCPGNRRWIQLVYDAWLLLPGSTSMLDARDAMLAADLARFGGANQKTLWRVFAQRGMGEFAYTADTDFTTPVPSFESPLADDEAVVTFKVLAGDEDGSAITNARILVGRFATRTRQIADTDPATVIDETDEVTRATTRNNLDTASLVPAVYDLIVVAPGYGIHRFEGVELKPGTSVLEFTLPTNWASSSKGATVTTSATLPENIERAVELIDDSEDTGAILGDEGNVIGSFATIALAGGEHEISRVHVSAAAGPTNGGRLPALRQFEIRICSGECSNPLTDFETVAYTSAPDAFPGAELRPTQPQLNLRAFDFPAVKASHVQLRVLHSQCSGGPLYQGDRDNDPLVNADCMTSSPAIAGLNLVLGGDVMGAAAGSYVRATDIQVFSSAASSAAPAKGGFVSNITRGRFGGALGWMLLLPLAGLALLRRRG